MPGFFGTEQQITLQAVAEEAREWTKNTPGACDPGRFLGTDDPDKLGWDEVLKILKRDGAFSFRMIPSSDTDAISRKLEENDCRIDFWDVFMASREDAVAASSTVLSSGLPRGFRYLPKLHEAENEEMVKVQSFMSENGIAPFSGTRLAGLDGPAVTIGIVDGNNDLSAVAHTCFAYNKFSEYNRCAWGGLVAVSPSHRGLGLGKFVNAKMVFECFSCLDADGIHEFVAASNIPSRKMVEASGLRLDPTVKCGIAMSGSGERFTE
jgi:hypothetical protein